MTRKLPSTVLKIQGRSALLGPALVAAVAYVDPGNVATNMTSGARYGYLLVWVIVWANLMACLVQYLSAKLGLVTGLSLPEAVRDRVGRGGRLAYWAQAEIVAVATDLAEVIGGAIALHLLFGLPLWMGGIITGVVSMMLLSVQDRVGQRPFERTIVGLLIVITVGFVAGLFVSPPASGDVLSGLIPGFDGIQSVQLAAGMLGATVMPHAVYLHSALARDRHGHLPEGTERRSLIVTTRLDVGVGMLLAGTVNLAMLLLAANVLRGSPDTQTLEGTHATVETALGPGIGLLFAIALLASGLASSSVGCYAGAVIMEGLIRRKIPLLLRRLVTLIPALVLLALNVEPTLALVLSQVILSFGIPFAVIPLVVLTARSDVMGADANRRITTILAAVVSAAVTTLNLALIYLTISGA